MIAAPPSSARELAAQLGVTLAEIADTYRAQRPAWATGDIAREDAHFIVEEALDAGTDTLIEIGTASGMSTGLLCFALDVARQAGRASDAYRVISYDVSERFYADRQYRCGDAAREILGDEMLRHIVFRNPATAVHARRELPAGSVRFLFIDANHQHPWPALDLLAMLPVLAPGATVVLHDINLPLLFPQWQDWGAKFLFDGVALEKRAAAESPVPGGPPNVGSLVMPDDPMSLVPALHRVIAAHAWEAVIPPAHLEALGVSAPR